MLFDGLFKRTKERVFDLEKRGYSLKNGCELEALMLLYYPGKKDFKYFYSVGFPRGGSHNDGVSITEDIPQEYILQKEYGKIADMINSELHITVVTAEEISAVLESCIKGKRFFA